MSISIKKYVDITSGVGAGAAVKERELILRLFTTNPLVPAATVLEMTSSDDAILKFGAASEEAKRAKTYFGFISKIITKAKKISFAPFNAGSTATPPSIVGATTTKTVDDFKAVTNGSLRINVGNTVYDVKGVNLGSVTSLADVATSLQAKLAAVTAGTTVAYDNVARVFTVNFVGNDSPSKVTVLTPTAGTDIAPLIGFNADALLSPGSAATTILDSVVEADQISDNYGSWTVMSELTLEQWLELASWNNSQNVKYQMLVPVTLANWKTWYEALQAYSGVALTLVDDDNTEHDEDIPGIILAATDYNQRNASQNYMFQQIAGFTPKVIDNELAQAIDSGSRVNYYGQTMNAGQNISFYQNGYLCGTSTAPLQMNVYGNEQWLKAACTAEMLKFLLNMPIIPATDEGRTMILAKLQEQVDRALFNGTIKPGKALNTDQKLYINTVTGDLLAWHQVQDIGYWMDAAVQEESQANGTIKYIIDYVLVYSKADAVNKITGRHILV